MVGEAFHSSLHTCEMETFEVESSVRGHQVYQHIRTPTLGEELHCEREDANSKNPYAVAVIAVEQ